MLVATVHLQDIVTTPVGFTCYLEGQRPSDPFPGIISVQSVTLNPTVTVGTAPGANIAFYSGLLDPATYDLTLIGSFGFADPASVGVVDVVCIQAEPPAYVPNNTRIIAIPVSEVLANAPAAAIRRPPTVTPPVSRTPAGRTSSNVRTAPALHQK
jgi:hypothetical protein